MEGEDFEEHEPFIAVAVGQACEAADLVVNAFHLAGADGWWKYESARASASRLMGHLNVQACREWYLARTADELPQNEAMPVTASGICRAWRLAVQV